MLSPFRAFDIFGSNLDLDLRDRGRFRATIEPPAPAPPRKPAMIGMVVFTTHHGERAEAILDLDGRWRCPVLPALDRVLNVLFKPGRDAAPASSFGHDQLDRVATWLNARVREVVIGSGASGGGVR